jgi:hypothetical protein
MNNRAAAFFAVSTCLGLGLFGLQACSGDSATVGGNPGTDSGLVDQTTTPPADGNGGGNDTGVVADTGSTPDTSPPPSGVCGFTTEAGSAFECDDSTMCAAGDVCCFEGNVQSDPVCGLLFGSKVKGTACRKACGAGELRACSRDQECVGNPGSQFCNAVSTKGHAIGVCAGSSGGTGDGGTADGGLDAGSDCGKAPTLHPTDGGVGPYCPFADSGNGTRSCALGQTCCHATNTDPEYCR